METQIAMLSRSEASRSLLYNGRLGHDQILRSHSYGEGTLNTAL